ncbi:hypothetical protein [Sinorhizobium meliloti]|uniref:hypothetical protein n=1 Tax=Rhizobium meliloti TaxID=382 RepID=UPI003B51DC21
MSSWISRHGSFYAIPPFGMLRHCLPEVSSLRSADRNLTATQVTRLAGIFSTAPTILRRMTFSNVAPASRRLIAARRYSSVSVIRVTTNRGLSFAASFSAGASPARFAAACTGAHTGMTPVSFRPLSWDCAHRRTAPRR